MEHNNLEELLNHFLEKASEERIHEYPDDYNKWIKSYLYSNSIKL